VKVLQSSIGLIKQAVVVLLVLIGDKADFVVLLPD